MPSSQRLAAGTRLNGIYVIDSLIADGGMGEVYRAHNLHTHDAIAIKMILPELSGNPEAMALFRREASTLNLLNNEAIVRYYVFTVDPDLQRAYLAMEFVDGEALSSRLGRGPLDLESARVLQQRLGEGLYSAHNLGIVHRDISPDNIILPGGDVRKAKIIDFGIARSLKSMEKTIIGSSFAGKMNYASPEQLGLAGGDVTGQSDIYSLGIVLAECLLGKRLAMGGTQVEIVEKRRKLPDLHAIDPSFRPLIEAMLQPLPERRPKDMGAVARWRPDIDDMSPRKAQRARLPAEPQGVAASARSRKIWIASAAGVIGLAAIAAGLVAFMGGNPFEPPKPDPLVAEVESPAPALPPPSDRPAMPVASGDAPVQAAPEPVEAPIGRPQSSAAAKTDAQPSPVPLPGPAPAPQAVIEPAPALDDTRLPEPPPRAPSQSAAVDALATPDAPPPSAPPTTAQPPPPASETQAGSDTPPPADLPRAEGPQAPTEDAMASAGPSRPIATPLPATPLPASPPVAEAPLAPASPMPAGHPDAQKPVQEPAQALSLVPAMKTWAARYSGGSCMYVHAISSDPTGPTIDVFGAERQTVDGFDKAFTAMFGVDAKIQARRVTAPQCNALAMLASVVSRKGNSLGLAVKSEDVRTGQPVAGTIEPGGGAPLMLLLLTDSGSVVNLSAALSADGRSFTAKMKPNDASLRLPQLIVALPADVVPAKLRTLREAPAAEVFDALRAQLPHDTPVDVVKFQFVK